MCFKMSKFYEKIVWELDIEKKNISVKHGEYCSLDSSERYRLGHG